MFAKVTYDDIVADILNAGIVTSPRGEKTYELLNASVQFMPGTMIDRKGMNENLGWLEALMMLSGTFNIEHIKKVAPRANHALYEYQSDYGPRVASQIEDVVNVLKVDEASRRAILYLNDRNQTRHDIACTTSIQFLIRNNTLYTTVNMRSWDVVYGMPMDIMIFSMMSHFVGALLGATPSRMRVNATSFHLYEKTRRLAFADPNAIRWALYNPEQFVGSPPFSLMRSIGNKIPDFIENDKLPFPLEWIENDERPFEFSYGINETAEGRG